MVELNTKLLELDLKPKELTVLLHIAKSANNERESSPRIQDLARDVKIGRDGIFKAIKGLISRGLITKSEDKANRNVYTIKTDYLN
jgi:DNA-binding MarR family transcriptional regulator